MPWLCHFVTCMCLYTKGNVIEKCKCACYFKIVRDVKIGKNTYIYVKMSKKHVKYRTFAKCKKQGQNN